VALNGFCSEAMPCIEQASVALLADRWVTAVVGPSSAGSSGWILWTILGISPLRARYRTAAILHGTGRTVESSTLPLAPFPGPPAQLFPRRLSVLMLPPVIAPGFSPWWYLQVAVCSLASGRDPLAWLDLHA
jgi:hypothetical protein